VFFRINMYRLGGEKRLEARRRVRRVAFLTVILSVNIAVAGLFVFAVILTGNAVRADEARLTRAQDMLIEYVAENGGSLTEQQIELLRARTTRVDWSDMLRIVSRLTGRDMWFTRMKLVETEDRRLRTWLSGLQLEGRLKAGRSEGSHDALMEFLTALREEPAIRRHFEEPKLVGSEWSRGDDGDYLEFEIFCQLADGSATGETR
jgi:hypothetical protein